MRNKNHQIYSTKDLLLLKDDPNKWIVKNMIPKVGSTLLFGDGGTYKTTVVFDLCVAIASGGSLLHQFQISNFGPVLINSTESSLFENRDRLLYHIRGHAVENAVSLPLYFCQQPFMLDSPDDVAELENAIKLIKPALIVLDPLDSLFSGDENVAKETKIVRRTLTRITTENQTSCLIIHHAPKEQKGKKATPRGSSAWYGWADSVILSTVHTIKLDLPEPIEFFKLESTKQRNGKRGYIVSAVPHINEDLQTTTFSYYDGKDFASVAQEYWKSKCYHVLMQAQEPLTANMIAEALGIRPEKVSQALTALEHTGLATKSGKLERPFGDGTKTRTINGWQALHPQCLVDLQASMLKAEEAVIEEQLRYYQIEPVDPNDAINLTNQTSLSAAGTKT